MQVSELPAYVTLTSAALGGWAYWLAIFPVDCIKSAMQTDTVFKDKRKYTNIMTTAKVGRGAALVISSPELSWGIGS
jgi:solute carrier family 25 carnitine/acylcarnitine transporter 20/29